MLSAGTPVLLWSFIPGLHRSDELNFNFHSKNENIKKSLYFFILFYHIPYATVAVTLFVQQEEQVQ